MYLVFISFNFIFVIAADKRKQKQEPSSSNANQIGDKIYSVPKASTNSIPPNKRNEIFKLISNEISSNEFRTFARNLDFADTEIKDLEVRNHDFRTRTMALLGLYEARKNNFKKLLGVLKLMGRNDLKMKIENLC